MIIAGAIVGLGIRLGLGLGLGWCRVKLRFGMSTYQNRYSLLWGNVLDYSSLYSGPAGAVSEDLDMMCRNGGSLHRIPNSQGDIALCGENNK